MGKEPIFSEYDLEYNRSSEAVVNSGSLRDNPIIPLIARIKSVVEQVRQGLGDDQALPTKSQKELEYLENLIPKLERDRNDIPVFAHGELHPEFGIFYSGIVDKLDNLMLEVGVPIQVDGGVVN